MKETPEKNTSQPEKKSSNKADKQRAKEDAYIKQLLGAAGKQRGRTFSMSFNPLILIVGILLIFFLIGGLLSQSNPNRNISVDEFFRGIESNRFSGILLQDNGEILAQEKYVAVTRAEEDDRISVPSDTKTVSMEFRLQEIDLNGLIDSFKPIDPLEQLRAALGGSGQTPVVELLVGDNFIIGRRLGTDSTDLLVRETNEDQLMTAIKDADLNPADLPVALTFLRSAAEEVNVDSLTARAGHGEFAAVYDLEGFIVARMKDSEIATFSITWDGGIRSFATALQDEDISLSKDNLRIGSIVVATVPWGDIISIITLVGFVVLAFVLFRGIQGSGSGLMKFGQTKARMFWGVKPDVTFKDVAGIDEAKEELNEIVEFLKHPNKFRKLGARIPKGVLMVGAPGTGKTLLARAIAGEAGVPFFHTSGSEFEEMLVGAGASRVRDLFEKAKKSAPALIFIDEIDAVARKRGTTIQSSTTEQTLNQILVEMDGFEKNVNVIVIAATNRPDVLDPAILRPGRFDRRVVIDLPDINGRKEILAIHSENKPLAADVDMEKVAKRTVGFSGADLENTLNEAAIIAAREDRKEITAHDIEEAATKVTLGPAKKSAQRTDEEINLVAVHEAGHAIVSKFVEGVDPVHRVTIIPRGMSGGATHFLPQDDSRIVSKKRLMGRIVVALGGRAAEEVILNDISTGASSDINSVTTIVRNMVQKYGMSDKLGLIKYGESNDLQYLGYGYGEQRDYSDDTAKIIDIEVREIVDAAYQQAKDIIVQHRGKFDELVDLLLEKEVIEADEFDALFKGESSIRSNSEEA